MRQLLLPVDPGEAPYARARWRDSPVVPGFGLRPLQDVLADVLAWRSRTASDEHSSTTPERGAPDRFQGVPTFRSGIRVPAGDLHAYAFGELDEAALDQWLRACLALSWRGVPCRWPAVSAAWLLPTLGLLHPLAEGLGDDGEPDSPKLAMGPDWAVRLAAGQVTSVHVDAVRRLRQAGWDAVPPPRVAGVDGACLAAALVPRCRGAFRLMQAHFAVRIRAELDEDGAAEVAGVADEESNPLELAQELS